MEIIMNDRNANLFFNNNGEEVAVITLNDEEGNEVEAAVMAVFQLEEQYPDYEFAVLKIGRASCRERV